MNGGKYHRQLWFWCFVVFICLSSCFIFFLLGAVSVFMPGNYLYQPGRQWWCVVSPRGGGQYPVSTRHRFDTHITSIMLKRRRTDVKTTSRAYWVLTRKKNISEKQWNTQNSKYIWNEYLRVGMVWSHFRNQRRIIVDREQNDADHDTNKTSDRCYNECSVIFFGWISVTSFPAMK